MVKEKCGTSQFAAGRDSFRQLKTGTVEELISDYEYRLSLHWDFLEKGAYDREIGGFMCELKDNGEVVDDEKRLWYQGRAVWICSFMYNNFGKETRFLEIAKKTRDFMTEHMYAGHGKWYEAVSRNAKIKEDVSKNIYGWLFSAVGLIEYYKAEKNIKDI